MAELDVGDERRVFPEPVLDDVPLRVRETAREFNGGIIDSGFHRLLLTRHLICPDSDCVGDTAGIAEDLYPHVCCKTGERAVGSAATVDPPCRLLAADELENCG